MHRRCRAGRQTGVQGAQQILDDGATTGPVTVSVVVPCLDEQDNIDAVYAEIVAELGGYDALEVLFVDDGSRDGTLAAVRALAAADPRVSYLSFTRNFGLEAAFSAGYRYARHAWIVHLDADLQFPPAEAHKLIATALQGYDAVFGIRVERRDHWVRRVSSRLHDLIARRLLGIELPPGATTFRVVRADLARRIVALQLATPYFLATVPLLTSAWTTVPTAHRARLHGRPKVHFAGLARHAVELFTAFSRRPMALAGLTCVGAALLALAAAITIAFGAGRAGQVLLAVALTGGLLALAVIARYLVHIGRGQARPPMYLIREANVEVAPEDLLPATLRAAS